MRIWIYAVSAAGTWLLMRMLRRKRNRQMPDTDGCLHTAEDCESCQRSRSCPHCLDTF